MVLVGPYIVKALTKMYTLRAMTLIDLATGWFEIAYVNGPNSETTLRLFDSYWLACYPQPTEVGIDNKNEFKSLFLELYNNFGLKVKPTTDYNPQGNFIVE